MKNASEAGWLLCLKEGMKIHVEGHAWGKQYQRHLRGKMGRMQGEDEIQEKPLSALTQLVHTLERVPMYSGLFSVPGEIIGGTECKPHTRPYMAHLEITTPQNSVMHCGGFLIRRNFVLTAAHCEGR